MKTSPSLVFAHHPAQAPPVKEQVPQSPVERDHFVFMGYTDVPSAARTNGRGREQEEGVAVGTERVRGQLE